MQLIKVAVAYALPECQQVIELAVPAGTSLLSAVRQSGIDSYFPGLDVQTAPLGLFGRLLPEAQRDTRQVSEGDRIEIYRPLIQSPEQARVARSQKQAHSPRK